MEKARSKDKTKTVKAWAIVNKKGILAFALGPAATGRVYFCSPTKTDAESERAGDPERVVPCTITYEVPERKR